jgi:cyclophilin family peptidyl-prolyl cis-trans isomerase
MISKNSRSYMQKRFFTSILVILVILASAVTTGCGGTQANRTAVIQTSMGTIKIELYEKRAPISTANFIKLAQQGYYDGLIFHRVKDNFVIQGGAGNPVPTIDLEIHAELSHVDGAVGMARSTAANSASSQFYICDGAQTGLDDSSRTPPDRGYAVFGKTIEGIDVVRAIASVDTGTDERPETDVVMTSITIIE